jgi:hypothetical protein
MGAGKQKSRVGGARPGAGRPAELRDAKRLTFHIEEADLEKLRTEAEKSERTVGELLREAVKAYLKGRKK